MNLLFWALIAFCIYLAINVNKERKKVLWKSRIILRFIAYGCIWAPITMMWSYGNFAKGSGYAMEIGAKGYGLYSEVKAIPKRMMGKIDHGLHRITPSMGRKGASKARSLLKAPVSLTREVLYDVASIGPKPKISTGQRVWRFSIRTLQDVILSPVTILKAVFV